MADSLDVTPVVCLELHPHYKTPLSRILNLQRKDVFDYSFFENIEDVHVPSRRSLRELNESPESARNKVLELDGHKVFLGRGGGVVHSTELLASAKLAPELSEIFDGQIQKAETSRVAVHMRGLDVFPRQVDLNKSRTLIERQPATIYSDCDPKLHFPDGDYEVGFPDPNAKPKSYEKVDFSTRTIVDLVSLLLMSRHDEIFLIQFNEKQLSNRYFGYRLSGFGLLAVALMLKRKKLERSLFRSSTIKTLVRLALQSPGQFPELMRAVFSR